MARKRLIASITRQAEVASRWIRLNHDKQWLNRLSGGLLSDHWVECSEVGVVPGHWCCCWTPRWCNGLNSVKHQWKEAPIWQHKLLDSSPGASGLERARGERAMPLAQVEPGAITINCVLHNNVFRWHYFCWLVDIWYWNDMCVWYCICMVYTYIYTQRLLCCTGYNKSKMFTHACFEWNTLLSGYGWNSDDAHVLMLVNVCFTKVVMPCSVFSCLWLCSCILPYINYFVTLFPYRTENTSVDLISALLTINNWIYWPFSAKSLFHEMQLFRVKYSLLNIVKTCEPVFKCAVLPQNINVML